MEKFVTFDCYGTLIDWKKGIAENFRRITGAKDSDDTIFKEYVVLEAEEEEEYVPYKRILERSFNSLSLKFRIKVNSSQSRDFSESIVRWPPFGDTVQVMKHLGKNGFRRVILSNVDRDLLEQTIINSGIEIDGFVTAEDVRSYKPNTAHWLYFFDHFGASKENTIHVAGSLYHDIMPAGRLGLKTVWVNRYNETLRNDVRYDSVIPNLLELPGLLNRLFGEFNP
jgi:2-haloacid dehalogenase